MENVILVIHLILALCLILIVLLQKSEGGGMGLGGGGGGGAMTGRQAATALTKLTWAFAIAFLCTSIVLTVLSAQNSAGGSVVDNLLPPASDDGVALPPVPDAESLLPPTTGDAPALPPRAE